jgi:hypothetical protein
MFQHIPHRDDVEAGVVIITIGESTLHDVESQLALAKLSSAGAGFDALDLPRPVSPGRIQEEPGGTAHVQQIPFGPIS